MTVAEEVETILEARGMQRGTPEHPGWTVQPDGSDAAVVSYHPPHHTFAKQELGMTVRPILESAGLHVELGGSLRPWQGYPPGVRTGRRDTGSDAAYRRRQASAPYLRVRRVGS